ncbi:MAG TPA: hypothetical protein VKU00_07630 [Chthonomonadaceae bacterium]|nr:hypothetical protein [Chthonomonadaceae bacterium]
MRTALLIIDPQVDFCDPERGALYVPGAEQDMARLAQMILRVGPQVDAIHVTLDSHHTVHIAHPIFWQDAEGKHPPPFTPVSAADVEAGHWTTTLPENRERALEYVHALERTGRYTLFLWPYHCLIGSLGHAVQPELFAALREWESRYAVVNYVLKGSNLWTEHYSAIRAEVPDQDDPATEQNTDLIAALRSADRVLIAGEAGSHCVANTVRDLADAFGHHNEIEKLVLLTDAVSPVTGFEQNQIDFVADLTRRGMRLATTEQPFP